MVQSSYEFLQLRGLTRVSQILSFVEGPSWHLAVHPGCFAFYGCLLWRKRLLRCPLPLRAIVSTRKPCKASAVKTQTRDVQIHDREGERWEDDRIGRKIRHMTRILDSARLEQEMSMFWPSWVAATLPLQKPAMCLFH